MSDMQGFTLVYDKWMPPDMYILVGMNQLVCYKNGKVQTFAAEEIYRILDEAMRYVREERRKKTP